MKKSLAAFDHFFVQDSNSKLLLNSIAFKNVTVAGDTRFDRVSAIIKQDNALGGLNEEKVQSICQERGSAGDLMKFEVVSRVFAVPFGYVKFILPHEQVTPINLS